VGFVSFPDKDLDALQLGGTLVWGPPPEVRYNQDGSTTKIPKTDNTGWFFGTGVTTGGGWSGGGIIIWGC